MSKIKAIPFKAAHVDLLELRNIESEWVPLVPNMPQNLLGLEINNSALTLIADGLVLAIVGFVPMSPGTIEAFILPSKHVPKYSLAFAKLMNYYLHNVLLNYEWHRLQILTPADKRHLRWAKFLGFEYEGTLRQAGIDKRDMYIYSKLREELICQEAH